MFYENFDKLCRIKGTSANAAAMAIGRAKGAAANWKANGTLPKEDELLALAAHLNCRVFEFFLENDRMPFRSRDEAIEYWTHVDEINPLTTEEPFPELDSNECDLVEVYRSCNKKQQMQLMLDVYSFAEENDITV